jgi:hypothetical protein
VMHFSVSMKAASQPRPPNWTLRERFEVLVLNKRRRCLFASSVDHLALNKQPLAIHAGLRTARSAIRPGRVRRHYPPRLRLDIRCLRPRCACQIETLPALKQLEISSVARDRDRGSK